MDRTIDAKSPGEPKAMNCKNLGATTATKSRRESTLALLMTRVLADDEQNAATLYELAFIADFLNAGTDFHDLLSRLGAIQSIAVYEESARIHKGLERVFRHSILNSKRQYILPKPPTKAH